ncbi:phosphoglycerate mutase-like protein [Lentithecium fluviatile CBS 122367]|uniref:Phosphoglycerate mutase-like protein n=1 Tax=Lentithecium fluviatile CBS 122367 TaxID=1168545 RepID=A0A6G1JGM9_9PLEO|nr:phosphoglycerate mutase-like protein [Lentithecium fluviatile CBS 122367]
MAKRLTLFLIRHGETVDNVAQVYAGSKDSALTNHGYQQATRLGQHLSALGWAFTHIFSSHLQRAAKTAGLIREAQLAAVADHGSPRTVPNVVRLPVLMEQDFGFYEGKKFYERPPDFKGTGKEHHRQTHKDVEGFVDIESKESLARRADAFLDGHLMPIIQEATEHTQQVIAVVSHGIMLSALWKRLLLRLPPRSVTLSTELAATPRPPLEHLGGWSNTGYLELYMTQMISQRVVESAGALPPMSAKPPAVGPHAPAAGTDDPDVVVSQAATSAPVALAACSLAQTVPPPMVASHPTPVKVAHGWTTIIETINGKDHLRTLKRTGGGVGSSRHDASQKNIDSFFKRRKVD